MIQRLKRAKDGFPVRRCECTLRYNAIHLPSRVRRPVRSDVQPIRPAEDLDAVVHGVVAYSPDILVAAVEGRGVVQCVRLLLRTAYLITRLYISARRVA